MQQYYQKSSHKNQKNRKEKFRLISTLTLLILLQIPFPFNSIGFKEIGIPSQSQNTFIPNSCTIFTISIDDKVFFGNNEDYLYDTVYQWYIPAQTIVTSRGNEDIYGAVFLGFDNVPGFNGNKYAQGGMNEHGLCFDANGLPSVTMTLDTSQIYPYTSNTLAQVLWECKNVSDVIQWYQKHGWGTMSGQIHYADKHGDAVVVSANTSSGKWAFTQMSQNSRFLVSTNFNLADHTNGWYPCPRYQTASDMLENITNYSELNVSRCADVLWEVHQEGTYKTRYSNIFDPTNLDVYFNVGNGYNDQVKYNILEELEENEESFSQNKSYFGVSGPSGHILTKTIAIPNELPTNTEEENKIVGISPWFLILIGFGSVSYIVVGYRHRK